MARQQSRATNNSHPNTGVEIFVRGLGLLSEQNPLADRPISFERSPRVFSEWGDGVVECRESRSAKSHQPSTAPSHHSVSGQEAGTCTRTVAFTPRGAAGTPQSCAEFTICELRFTNGHQMEARPRCRARLVNRQSENHQLSTELVPEVGIVPTSPRLQPGANLPQLLEGARCANRQ